MPAALGRDLVFDMDGRHTGSLKLADCTDEIYRIAIAGVGVGDDRNIRR